MDVHHPARTAECALLTDTVRSGMIAHTPAQPRLAQRTGNTCRERGAIIANLERRSMHHNLPVILADTFSSLQDWAKISQTVAGILTGIIAALGVPLALRQVINLQRELRRYEVERRRRIDAETNLNITSHYSLTHAAHPGQQHRPGNHGRQSGQSSGQPSPDPLPGKRVLRLDLGLENVGEGSVDVLACLVAARELERQGEEVVAEGRDAQWDDLTRHYWNAGADTFSPGLSTTKHIVYAPDGLARIKAHSRKTLARIDQVRDFSGEVYLLYRVFVAARRSARGVDDLRDWATLQRALLNVNAPAFREASAEEDPLGRVASLDGWRLFLHYFNRLADPRFPALRAQADHELSAVRDPEEYARARVRLDAALQDYVRQALLPVWQEYCADLRRIAQDSAGFAVMLADKSFRRRQREVERRFPWNDQEIWIEYFYVALEAE
jgi:hypothetical protein